MNGHDHSLASILFMFAVTKAIEELHQRHRRIPIPAKAAARPPHTLPRRGLPRRICRG